MHQGCPKCSNQQSLAEEEIVSFLKEILPNVEIGQRNRSLIKPYEVDIFIPSYKLAIEYNGLVWHSDKFCEKDMSKKKITSTEDLIKQSKEIFGDKYSYDKTDISKKDEKRRVTFTCPIHGDFLQDIYSHLRGCGCPKCGKESMAKAQSFTTEQFCEKANKIHNGKYIYTDAVYKGATQKVDIICPTHGVFSQVAYSHLQGHGCPQCAREEHFSDMLMTKEEFIGKANIVHNCTEDYSSVEYKGAKVPVQIKCSNGHTYWQTPNKHLLGQGCPYCSHNISKQETEITDFIKEECNLDVDNNNRKLLSDSKELDIVVPSKETAIEFNGLLWHSEQFGNDKEYYHLNKTVACNNQGIRLVHIFEDEWLYKKNIVKSKLMEILQCSTNVISANDCEIKNISSKEYINFLENNSLEEKPKTSKQYGLYYNNELVSVIGISKLIKRNEIDVLVYCNKLNTFVDGGEKKLLDYIIETLKPIRMIIDLDRRLDDGKAFEEFGFKFHHSSPPTYYYVVGKHRKDRMEFGKDKLVEQGFDKDKSEQEIMEERGIYRIFDCGKLVFEWKKKNE